MRCGWEWFNTKGCFTAVEECPLLMEMNPSHISLYSVMVGEVGSLCLPSRPMSTSVHSLLWHAEALFFRRGMEAMPWRVHTRKTRPLPLLSGSKGRSLISRQLIWKSPGNQDHSHISSACTHAFTCWQALPTSSQGWLFWTDFSWKTPCARTGFKSTEGLLWTYFSPGSTTGSAKTLPPVRESQPCFLCSSK